jgi:NodT family efflux transporter outer membrane factor (OMF) lipoprotein
MRNGFPISSFRLLSSFVIRHSSLFLLAGCSIGPDYHRLSALGTNATPSAYSIPLSATNSTEWKVAAPAAQPPRGPWWDVFHDPELDRLESLAQINNQDLAAAVARFDEARASVNIARSDWFPQVQLDPSYARQRTSFNEPQNGESARAAHTYNAFNLNLQAAWEIDLWGRVRRQVEAARARLAASADDLGAINLAVQAEVATDYFALRALDSEYDLIQRTAEAYRRSLELTLNRRKGGVASDLDVSQAETQLRATEAQLPALQLDRSRLTHALAVLCGQSATSFSLTPAALPSGQTPAVPAALPSQLLERRPDIAAAEKRMAAANADIGVAEGAFYPRLTLNGLAGFQSVDSSTWFDWPSRLWAVGPSLELPLFTGGRNRAQLAFARASYNETVANYRQTVLSGFQEVEDQLAAQVLLESQINAQTAALTAANQTLRIANNRYKAGLVTYLEVATAQSVALNVERTVVQLRGQKLVATVGLIRALGGGWQSQSQAQASTRLSP